MKIFTIKIIEKNALYIDVFAENEEEAIELTTKSHESGMLDLMKRECDFSEYEIADVKNV